MRTTIVPPGTSLVQVSANPYTNLTGQDATEVEPGTIAVGSTIVSVFQVPRFANCFANCGADNIGWATSTDGRQTWPRGRADQQHANGVVTLSLCCRPACPFNCSRPAI